jgi:hypothetical protein
MEYTRIVAEKNDGKLEFRWHGGVLDWPWKRGGGWKRELGQRPGWMWISYCMIFVKGDGNRGGFTDRDWPILFEDFCVRSFSLDV